MTDIFRPETEAQLIDVLAWANSDSVPLEMISLATKRALGRPVQAAHTLDMSAFSGISLYEPEELILAAGPATPLSEIEAVLQEKDQQLAFEPPDLSGLLSSAHSGSIGGGVAANLAGSRRIKEGAARDHFLGFDAVSGRAQAVKSGGRVMKNVTGYDLSKLLCGSYGTLAAMTKLVVKVLPTGQKTRTVLIYGIALENAVVALADGLNGPFEVSGAAWLPESITQRSSIDRIQGHGPVAVLRLEGFGPSVEYRCARLRQRLAKYGETAELHSHNSRSLWKDITNVVPFHGDNRVVWKISTAPAQAPRVLSGLSHLKDFEAYMDWAGGLIWLAVDAPKQGAHEPVRELLGKTGGYGILMRGSQLLRNAVPVFHPQPAPVAALNARLKQSFDPNDILNPGRMTGPV